MLIVSSYKYSLTPCPLSLFILEQPLRTGSSETLAQIPGKKQLHKRGSSQYAWHHLKAHGALRAVGYTISCRLVNISKILRRAT